MPGNVPNVSRNSFDGSKFYDKITMQQGVPIPDSDWNELNDVLRMTSILQFDALMGGSFTVDNGFLPINGTPTSNNFACTAGWAIVNGVLAPTTNADPPGTLQYDSEDNFLVAGTVTAIDGGSGKITDDEQLFQAFHDLIATANHGACRVKMLSGTEVGNYFDITAYSSTQLTLSGGIGSINVGDTFKVLPPLLTTPGGARNDSAYIMVWWEDIASEEDSNIEHPGLGVETAHRSQRRWTVRVNEDTTSVPSTANTRAFAVRYLKFAQFARTATATIDFGSTVTLTSFNNKVSFLSHINSTSNPHSVLASQVTFTPYSSVTSTDVQAAMQEVIDDVEAHIADVSDPHSVTATQTTFTPYSIISSTNVQAAVQELIDDFEVGDGRLIGVNTDYGNGSLTDADGGGIGDVDPGGLNVALSNVDSALVNRRAFTAVLSDGTNSTNGDFNSANAIDNIDDFTRGGYFMLRRGRYTWSSVTALQKPDVSIVGEMFQWGPTATSDLTSLEIPAVAGSDFSIQGAYKNLIFSSKHASRRYNAEGVTFENIQVQSGTMVIDGPIKWIGGGTQAALSGNNPTANYGIEFRDITEDPTGFISQCYFGSAPSSGAQTAAVYINGYNSLNANVTGLHFKSCIFDGSSVAGQHAVAFGAYCNVPITFDSCTFLSGDGGYGVYTTDAFSNENIVFRNCYFFNDRGTLVRFTGDGYCSSSFVNCKFYSGGTPPSSFDIALRIQGATIENCTGSLGVSSRSDSEASLPSVQLGNALGNNPIIVNGFRLAFGGSLHNFSTVVVYGTAVGNPSIVRDLYLNVTNPAASDRGTNGVLNRAAILELVGDTNTDRTRLICYNIHVNGIKTDTAVNDNGCAVGTRNCTINGLTVDGNAQGPGSFGNAGGVIYTSGRTIIRDLQYCPGMAIRCTGDFIIRVGSTGIIDGGEIYKITNTYQLAILGFVGATAAIQNLKCYSLSNHVTNRAIIASNLSHDECTVHNNTFRFSGGTHNGSTLIDLIGGNQCIVTNNFVEMVRSSNTAVTCTGSDCLVDSNSFHYSGGGGTPSISNGSGVTGDNVLAP